MCGVSSIDISENEILYFGEDILNILLADRTANRNILWATSDYEIYGKKFNAQSPIEVESITGKYKNIIQPRVYKEKVNQTTRTKDKAEVFTPSWMCNVQNNLVDKSWFGRDNVFNMPKGQEWISTKNSIEFENKPNKRWQDYVDILRLEITCGEAPYLVSRYDSVTGSPIDVPERIGLLDRKLRVVNENTITEKDWIKWAIRAFQSIYGFEFQGDNLLLARENLLYTFIDYVNYKFNRNPSHTEIKKIADIISWNIWQMDGKKFTVPFESTPTQYTQLSIFDNDVKEERYCKIKDWRSRKVLTYISLINAE